MGRIPFPRVLPSGAAGAPRALFAICNRGKPVTGRQHLLLLA